MQKNIELLLEIGFADFLSLEKRKALMYSGMEVSEFRNKFRCDYSREVKESLKWLEKGGNRKIWVYGSPGYPDFSPLEKYLPFFLFILHEVIVTCCSVTERVSNNSMASWQPSPSQNSLHDKKTATPKMQWYN